VLLFGLNEKFLLDLKYFEYNISTRYNSRSAVSEYNKRTLVTLCECECKIKVHDIIIRFFFLYGSTSSLCFNTSSIARAIRIFTAIFTVGVRSYSCYLDRRR
jgi:hypothetical protein